MTRLGFALDQRTCIGCHACTVACKQEHGTELGVFRTWVKYIEDGTFPEVKRSFTVLRCNHCDDAPCIEICPVTALYRREDGVVDFDPERCIGCKACLNGCPYDALYMDPGSHTAAKCNFCAHRVDVGLKPACEVVCPTRAIVSGDLDDPASELSLLLESTDHMVRAPEQKTYPKVFYLGAEVATLDPLAVGGAKEYLSEVQPSQREKLAPLADPARPVVMSDVAHPPPWGWRVSSYFLTKGAAAGAMMLAALLLSFGGGESGLADTAPAAIALVGIALTGIFLVWDLGRPDRVHLLFLRPQWRSWLAIGAQVINLAALLALAFAAASFLDLHGARDVLRWALIPTGALLACYTAFLFNQCEGRDLWQSRLLLPQTLANALVAGAAALGLAAPLFEAPEAMLHALGWAFAAGIVAGTAVLAADVFGRHPTAQAERAALNLRRDLYARRFWLGVGLGSLGAGAAVAAFLVVGAVGLLAAGGALALIGQWLYEDAWVRAGQSVPLS